MTEPPLPREYQKIPDIPIVERKFVENYCVKALVTGRVQGVFYRRSTQEQAREAGVTGHAVNLPDGRVEVVLCGDTAQVRRVSEWLWQGPDQARVTHVEIEVVTGHAPDGFTTG